MNNLTKLAILYWICGWALAIASFSTIRRIYNSSKSTFAYTLLGFTAFYALNYLLLGFYYFEYTN